MVCVVCIQSRPPSVIARFYLILVWYVGGFYKQMKKSTPHLSFLKKIFSRRADLRDLRWTTKIHLSILISSVLPELQSLSLFFFVVVENFFMRYKALNFFEAIFFPISTWHIRAPFHLLLWIIPRFPLFCSLLWDVYIIYGWLCVEPESNLNSGDI